MGLLDTIEKALFEQKSEAKREEELKGIKVFDLPSPEQKFSWKMAWDLAKGKEIESKPNRYHYQDIMLERNGNFDLIRVYKRKMTQEEGMKATLEFNKYMQSAVMGHSTNKQEEKEKKFSWSKFWDLIKNASDDEIRLARGKSKEFNDMVEKEEARRNYKSVEISVDKIENNSKEKDQGNVTITQVMKVSPDGSARDLGKMYRKRMTEKEVTERRKNGEHWRKLEEQEKRTYVRFEKEKSSRER